MSVRGVRWGRWRIWIPLWGVVIALLAFLLPPWPTLRVTGVPRLMPAGLLDRQTLLAAPVPIVGGEPLERETFYAIDVEQGTSRPIEVHSYPPSGIPHSKPELTADSLLAGSGPTPLNFLEGGTNWTEGPSGPLSGDKRCRVSGDFLVLLRSSLDQSRVSVWNWKTGAEVFHRDYPVCDAWLLGDRVYVEYRDRETVAPRFDLFDVATGNLIPSKLPADRFTLLDGRTSLDGRYAVRWVEGGTGRGPRRLSVWNFEPGEELFSAEGVFFAISPDSRWLGTLQTDLGSAPALTTPSGPSPSPAPTGTNPSPETASPAPASPADSSPAKEPSSQSPPPPAPAGSPDGAVPPADAKGAPSSAAPSSSAPLSPLPPVSAGPHQILRIYEIATGKVVGERLVPVPLKTWPIDNERQVRFHDQGRCLTVYGASPPQIAPGGVPAGFGELGIWRWEESQFLRLRTPKSFQPVQGPFWAVEDPRRYLLNQNIIVDAATGQPAGTLSEPSAILQAIIPGWAVIQSDRRRLVDFVADAVAVVSPRLAGTFRRRGNKELCDLKTGQSVAWLGSDPVLFAPHANRLVAFRSHSVDIWELPVRTPWHWIILGSLVVPAGALWLARRRKEDPTLETAVTAPAPSAAAEPTRGRGAKKKKKGRRS